jgi:hypothetical protein
MLSGEEDARGGNGDETRPGHFVIGYVPVLLISKEGAKLNIFVAHSVQYIRGKCRGGDG